MLGQRAQAGLVPVRLEIRNEAGEPVASGSTLHACWDPATSRMIAVPPWLQALMPVIDGPEARV